MGRLETSCQAQNAPFQALEEILQEFAPVTLLGLCYCTSKANRSKDLLDTFETTTGGILRQLLGAWRAKCEAKLIHLIHAQESALFPAPGECIDTTGTHSEAQTRL